MMRFLTCIFAVCSVAFPVGRNVAAEDANRAPAGDCTATIAFADCPEGNLDPTKKEKVVLSWHATAKGDDCGVCVVSCTAVLSNKDGTNAEVVQEFCSLADPALPHILKGKGAGGTIKAGTEAFICEFIKKKNENNPGAFDRICITVTIVCTKGRQVTAQDSDVCCLICPSK